MTSKLALFGGEAAVRVCRPPSCVLDDTEVGSLHEAIERARTDWSYLSAASGAGPVGGLESAVAAYLGVRYVLAVSSGTAALFTALRAGDIGPGDEVIVPTYTWGQSAAPILHIGARPVFVDIDPVTYTISSDDVESRITLRTRAIVVVHLFGHPADLTPLRRIADARGLLLVEDAAQAMGAAVEQRRIGTFGDAACFSLGRDKPVSGGEGGILMTDDPDLFERAVRLTQHPLRQRHELLDTDDVTEFNYGLRIHPIAAVLARAQLATLEERLCVRRRFYGRLAEALGGIGGIRAVRPGDHVRHAWYRCCPTFVPEQMCGGAVSRARYLQALIAEGVPIAPDPIRMPLHRRSLRPFGIAANADSCPEADDRCARTGLALASWLPDVEDERLVDSLAHAFRKVAAHAGDLIEIRGTATTHRL